MGLLGLPAHLLESLWPATHAPMGRASCKGLRAHLLPWDTTPGHCTIVLRHSRFQFLAEAPAGRAEPLVDLLRVCRLCCERGSRAVFLLEGAEDTANIPVSDWQDMVLYRKYWYMGYIAQALGSVLISRMQSLCACSPEAAHAWLQRAAALFSRQARAIADLTPHGISPRRAITRRAIDDLVLRIDAVCGQALSEPLDPVHGPPLVLAGVEIHGGFSSTFSPHAPNASSGQAALLLAVDSSHAYLRLSHARVTDSFRQSAALWCPGLRALHLHDGGHSDPSGAMDFVRQFPCLQELEVFDYEEGASYDSPLDMAHLASLRRVKLQFKDRLGVPYWKVRRLLTCMPAEDACLEELYLSLSWDGPLGLTFTKTFPRTLRHLTLDLAPIWGHSIPLPTCPGFLHWVLATIRPLRHHLLSLTVLGVSDCTHVLIVSSLLGPRPYKWRAVREDPCVPRHPRPFAAEASLDLLWAPYEPPPASHGITIAWAPDPTHKA